MYVWSNLFYFYSIFCPINEIFKKVISAFSLRCKVWNFWVLWCLGCVEDKIRNCCFKKVKKKSTLCSLIELIGLFADNPPGINQHLNQRRCTAVSALLTASATAFIFVHCKFYTVRSAECSMHCKALQ